MTFPMISGKKWEKPAFSKSESHKSTAAFNWAIALSDKNSILGKKGSAWQDIVVPLGEIEDVVMMGTVLGGMAAQLDLLAAGIRGNSTSADRALQGIRVAPPLELKKLLVPFSVEALFRHKALRMLLDKGKMTQEMIAMLSSWRHSGFNIFCGNRISPNDDTAMENLARFIIRASFSQERIQYLDQERTVVYASRDGATTRNFRPGMAGCNA